MVLEGLLNDGQHLLVHEACNGVLHHLLFFSELAAQVVEVEGVKRGGHKTQYSIRGFRHCALQSTLPHGFCYRSEGGELMQFTKLVSKGLIVAIATATLGGCYTMDPYSNEKKVSKT